MSFHISVLNDIFATNNCYSRKKSKNCIRRNAILWGHTHIHILPLSFRYKFLNNFYGLRIIFNASLHFEKSIVSVEPQKPVMHLNCRNISPISVFFILFCCCGFILFFSQWLSSNYNFFLFTPSLLVVSISSIRVCIHEVRHANPHTQAKTNVYFPHERSSAMAFSVSSKCH